MIREDEGIPDMLIRRDGYWTDLSQRMDECDVLPLLEARKLQDDLKKRERESGSRGSLYNREYSSAVFEASTGLSS